MKKIICVFLLATSLFGQSAGNSGLAFLKFGFGARNVALSDLGVVGTNDLTALNYNPADLAAEKNNQLLFTHNSLFTDLSAEMFGASFNLWGLPLALGINTTNISDIEVRTTPGPAEATFSAHYFNGSISTAHEIAGNLYAGVTFKYLYENMYSDDAEDMDSISD